MFLPQVFLLKIVLDFWNVVAPTPYIIQKNKVKKQESNEIEFEKRLE